MKYHIAPYNFEEFDFDKLQKEEKENNGEIFWHFGEKKYNFDEGEICYFYCTNLPDMTRRILLKAEISVAECKDKEGELCYKTRNLSSICLKEEHFKSSDFTYSFEKLRDEYGFACIRGKQSIVPKFDGENQELIEKRKLMIQNLEKEPSTGDLSVVRDYFSKMTKCVFEGKFHKFNICKTFYKPNGFFYYETHHVIQQNLQKNTKKNKKLLQKCITCDDIEDLRNKVYVCPVCHRKIHSGKKNIVRRMIDYLYTREETVKAFYDECYTNFADKESFKDTLDWLYAIYNVGDKSLKE